MTTHKRGPSIITLTCSSDKQGAHSLCFCLLGVVWQWWQGEIERRALLSRATCLHKAYTTQRDLPTSQVPTYLEARVAAGHAVPVVGVVSPQSQIQQEEEETRHAVLEYVVKGLNEALLTELLEGFHCGT
jgi:hypothetical protein